MGGRLSSLKGTSTIEEDYYCREGTLTVLLQKGTFDRRGDHHYTAGL